MKKFLKSITQLLNSIAEARAATALTNLRQYEAAAKLMQKK